MSDWQARAACADYWTGRTRSDAPDIFDRADPNAHLAAWFCGPCPVKAECAADASRDDHGYTIRGGLNIPHALTRSLKLVGESKRCVECGEMQDYAYFRRSQDNATGRDPRCRACRAWARRHAGVPRPTGDTAVPAEKECGACGATRPADQFYLRRRGALPGLSTLCKACTTVRNVNQRRQRRTEKGGAA